MTNPARDSQPWPTYGAVMRATWPRKGYVLPDGARVIEARQAPANRQGGPMMVHLCLADGSCRSGRLTSAVRHG